MSHLSFFWGIIIIHTPLKFLDTIEGPIVPKLVCKSKYTSIPEEAGKCLLHFDTKICRNWMKNYRVLIIWIKTGMFEKNANIAVQQYTDLLHLQSTVESLHLHSNRTSLYSNDQNSVFLIRLLQIWDQNKADICVWYPFNLPITKFDFYKCPGTFFTEWTWDT